LAIEMWKRASCCLAAHQRIEPTLRRDKRRQRRL
jgi:hypothetical protein